MRRSQALFLGLGWLMLRLFRLQLAAIPLLDPEHAARERVSPFSFSSRRRFLITELSFADGSAEALQGEARSRPRPTREARTESRYSPRQHFLYLVELG